MKLKLESKLLIEYWGKTLDKLPYRELFLKYIYGNFQELFKLGLLRIFNRKLKELASLTSF